MSCTICFENYLRLLTNLHIYWNLHEYPVIEVYAYYNDKYYKELGAENNAPATWDTSAVILLDGKINDAIIGGEATGTIKERETGTSPILQEGFQNPLIYIGLGVLILIVLGGTYYARGKKRGNSGPVDQMSDHPNS